MLICDTDFTIIENSHIWQIQRIGVNVREKVANAHAFEIKQQQQRAPSKKRLSESNLFGTTIAVSDKTPLVSS